MPTYYSIVDNYIIIMNDEYPLLEKHRSLQKLLYVVLAAPISALSTSRSVNHIAIVWFLCIVVYSSYHVYLKD